MVRAGSEPFQDQLAAFDEHMRLSFGEGFRMIT
jgi:hypothetical protein